MREYNNMIRGDYKDEVFSKELNEIINHKPHWIIRNGNSIFLMVFAMVFLITFFIKYPESVSGSVRLFVSDSATTSQPYYFGELSIGQNSAKKLKIGQTANLKIKNALSQELYAIEGTVDKIIPVAQNVDSFIVVIRVPATLLVNKDSSNGSGVSASVQLFFDNRSVFDRVYRGLRILEIKSYKRPI